MAEIIPWLEKCMELAGQNPFVLLALAVLAVVFILGKALLHFLPTIPPFVRVLILVIIVAGFVGFLILQGSIINGGVHALGGSD